MLGATYIQRHPKTGGYWFRRRVPDQLRSVIGQREITRTLGTKSLNEAKRRSRSLANATDELFIEASGFISHEGNDGTASSNPATPQSCSTPPSDRPASWVTDFISKCIGSGPEIVVDADNRVAAVLIPLTMPEAPPTTMAPQEPPPPPPSSQMQPPPLVESNTMIAVPVQPPIQQTTNIMTIIPRQRVATVQGLFDRYLAEFERRPRTERTWRRHLDMFLEISGLSWEAPVHTVTDAHVEDFILAMKRLPARRIDAFYKGLTLLQIIEKFGDRADLPKLDQKTINTKMDALRAIFYYGLRHKYLDDNPFVGKTSKRVSRRAPPKRRLPFDVDELRTIFSSDIFTPPCSEWGSKAWITVIAAYSGCRLEEIGQLRVSDYRVRGGVQHFAITAIDLGDEGGQHGDKSVPAKSLKTDTADREVPVHPVLLRLGLPEYVNRMRKRKESRLFPDIISARDEVTAAFSKWFGRWLNRLGITSPTKVFHSFRHGFKDGCRNNGVPKEIAEAMMGHAGTSVGDSYGSGYSITVLAKEMEKVAFGLDWEVEVGNPNNG
jgi:integrase